MTDYMAQMLNELMGSQRDALPGESRRMRFDDREVCTDFLVGFCTHELFRNTKNDLGFCDFSIHDENMRLQYKESDKRFRMGFEEKFLDRIKGLNLEVRRKIEKHEQRLVATQGDCTAAQEAFDKKLESLKERIEVASKKIDELMEEAQQAGQKGNVGSAQTAVEKADKMKLEREELYAEERKINQDKSKAMVMEENVTAGNRQMQVCQVCGCFMLLNDAQQRIDDHLSGKLHIAYQTIADAITSVEKELEEHKAKKDSSSRRDREKDDKKRPDRSRSRERDRRRDDRDRGSGRDRDRGSGRDRDRGDKNRDKEKERDRRDDRRHDRDRGDRRDKDRGDRGDRRDRDRGDRDRDHRRR